MVRLTDLPTYEREHLIGKNLAPLGPTPWVNTTRPLPERRLALVTTAGLHLRSDPAFNLADASYRLIPDDVSADDIQMSHSSINFDRSAFQEDINVVFPIDRLHELVRDSVVGASSRVHVSFMGAGLLPQAYESSARGLARLLRLRDVDSVFLTPV